MFGEGDAVAGEDGCFGWIGADGLRHGVEWCVWEVGNGEGCSFCGGSMGSEGEIADLGGNLGATVETLDGGWCARTEIE